MLAVGAIGVAGLTATEDWWTHHPAGALFGIYATAAMAYLVSRALIAMAVTASTTSVNLVPVPFHGDACNGFSPIGYFAVRNLIVALVVFAGWAHFCAYVAADAVKRSELSTHRFLILYAVGFLWVMVSDLAMTVWDAHVVMERHRSDVLAATSAKMAELVAAFARTGDPPDAELLRLAALETRYQLERREYTAWPFGYSRIAWVAGFSFIVGPAVSALWRDFVGWPS
jgi:hypothetical protein